MAAKQTAGTSLHRTILTNNKRRAHTHHLSDRPHIIRHVYVRICDILLYKNSLLLYVTFGVHITNLNNKTTPHPLVVYFCDPGIINLPTRPEPPNSFIYFFFFCGLFLDTERILLTTYIIRVRDTSVLYAV